MNRLKIILLALLCSLTACASCSKNNGDSGTDGNDGHITSENKVEQNLLRSMQLIDNAMSNYFDGTAMSRYYNPYTGVKSDEIGSVWMYTSAIEAVNAVLAGLDAQKNEGDNTLYDKYFTKYSSLLSKLFDGLAYYEGSFRLTSFTGTNDWSVYAVNRASSPGSANVTGVLNVYDDQQWLVRELIESYKLTGENRYLEKAEYLASYVLDGWDCTLDENGNENGGIPWGPGYTTKHSCSNGPFISPLVWLSEMYKDKSDVVDYKYIEASGSRVSKSMLKSEYYLMYARKVYDYMKSHLYIQESGVYDDMMGGIQNDDDKYIIENGIAYEMVDGVKYRANTKLNDRVGPPISYNSGTMLSGAADLYRVTSQSNYLEDLEKLTDDSFKYFAKKDVSVKDYYTYTITGFNNWFNGVLCRGYVDASEHTEKAALPVKSFQDNLDYAYDKFLYQNMLPESLLGGWNRDTSKNSVEGMFTFAFAAEYAVLAKYLMLN